MGTPLLPDALWNLIQPLLLPSPRRSKGGRPRLQDRACLTGILFVLRSGIPWEMLPRELGCGSGMTCWRRLRDWQEAGIWQLIHFPFLDWLARYGEIDWSRAVVDGSSIRAVFGGCRRDQSHRPGQAGLQASSNLRRSRGSSRHSTDWSQS
jgi:transposase